MDTVAAALQRTRETLLSLFDDKASIEQLARDAGVDWGDVVPDGSPRTLWWNVFSSAPDRVLDIIGETLRERHYPNNEDLRNCLAYLKDVPTAEIVSALRPVSRSSGESVEVSLTAGRDIVVGNNTTIQNYYGQRESIPKAPYKFLSYYDIGDRDIFFGRDSVIDKLVGRIAQHRVLTINGQSGAGKTSLINAGLIPRLAENDYLYVCFRDYSDPLKQIREHFATNSQFQVAGANELSLLQILQRICLDDENSVVIILDQFERFLTDVAAKAKSEFLEQLRECIEGDLSSTQLNLLISLRDDFYGKLLLEAEDAIPSFASESRNYNLRTLSREEARAAIVRPLMKLTDKIGFKLAFVDNVLLPHLMGHTRHEQIQPPHLQIVCNQLYEKACGQYAKSLENGEPVVIDEELYNSLGRTQGILRNYLDDVVDDITNADPKDVGVVRSLLKTLVNSSGTRKFLSIEAICAELPGVSRKRVSELIEQLETRRIVETQNRSGHSLSHEFLVEKVRNWYDEREIEKKRAAETLQRCLVAWKSTRSRLDRPQLELIKRWIPPDSLTVHESVLLAKSEFWHRWSRRGLVTAVVTVLAMTTLAGGGWWKADKNFRDFVEERTRRKERDREFAQASANTLLLTANTLLDDDQTKKGLLYLLAAHGSDALNTAVVDRMLLLAAQRPRWQLARRIELPRGASNYSVSRDFGRIAILEDDNGHIWDWSSDPVELQSQRPKDLLVAFTKDGSKLVSYGDEGRLTVWSVATGKLMDSTSGKWTHTESGPDEEPPADHYRLESPDSRWTGLILRDHGLHKAEMLPEESVSVHRSNGEGWSTEWQFKYEDVNSIAFSPCSSEFFVFTQSELPSVVDLSTHDEFTYHERGGTLREGASEFKLSFGRGSAYLWVRRTDPLEEPATSPVATQKWWRGRDLSQAGKIRLEESTEGYWTVSNDSGSKFEFSWTVPGKVEAAYRENSERADEEFVEEMLPPPMTEATVSGNGQIVASMATGRGVAIWNVGKSKHGRPVPFLKLPFESSTLALDANGERLMLRDVVHRNIEEQGSVQCKLFSIPDGRKLGEWTESGNDQLLSVSNNSRFLTSILDSGQIVVFDLLKESKVGVPVETGEPVLAGTCDSKGQTLVAALSNGTIGIWGTEVGEPIGRIKFDPPTDLAGSNANIWFSDGDRVINLAWTPKGSDAHIHRHSWRFRFASEKSCQALGKMVMLHFGVKGGWVSDTPISRDGISMDPFPAKTVSEIRRELVDSELPRRLLDHFFPESIPVSMGDQRTNRGQ